MLRRDFVRSLVAVGLLPKALLGQQTANPAPPAAGPGAVDAGADSVDAAAGDRDGERGCGG
jgi:hypothetical protein